MARIDSAKVQGFKLFLLFIVSFLSAIWLADLFFYHEYVKLVFFICFLILFFLQIYRCKLICFLVLFLGLFAGGLRYFVAIEHGDELLNYQGSVSISGCISEDPELKEFGRRYTFEVFSLYYMERWIDVDGKTLVFAPLYPSFEYGDCLRFNGVISEPEDFDDFSYKNYLSRYDIYTVTYVDRAAEIEKIEKNSEGKNFAKNFFLSSLISLRNMKSL